VALAIQNSLLFVLSDYGRISGMVGWLY